MLVRRPLGSQCQQRYRWPVDRAYWRRHRPLWRRERGKLIPASSANLIPFGPHRRLSRLPLISEGPLSVALGCPRRQWTVGGCHSNSRLLPQYRRSRLQAVRQ